MADSHVADAGMDIEAASERIGASLFGSASEPDGEGEAHEVQAQREAPATPPARPGLPDAPPAPVDLLPAPKSWRQDMHQHWAKMPREAQQYYNEREQQMLNGMQQYKQVQSAIAPVEPYLSQRGVTVSDWIRAMAQAEMMLTQGTPEQRRAAYQQLGQQLGMNPPHAEQHAPVDPAIKQLQDRQEAIERGLMAQHAQVMKETRAKIDGELDVFAGDPAHPHFDEVAADTSPRGLVAQIEKGLSLQEAYDAAVWANPVTRAKEQAAALTAHEAKLKENARLTALPKRKAASVNVRSAEKSGSPTEPIGSMDDTIRATLREIRSRAS